MLKYIRNTGTVGHNKIWYFFFILILMMTSFISNGRNIYHKPNQDDELSKQKLSFTSIINEDRIFDERQDTISQNNRVTQSNANINYESNPYSEYKSYTLGRDTKKGAVSYRDSTIKIVASGSDIGNTNDEGYFLFKPVRGDFEISVRVRGLSPNDLFTKAGIMARVDLSDNSKNVFFFVFPDNQERDNNNGGCEFQYRAKRRGETAAIYPAQQTAGYRFHVNYPDTWIKVIRSGNIFTTFISTDNVYWNQYSTHSQKMPKNLLLGLAVTSHDPNGFANAEFSDLQIKFAD